MVPSLVIMQRVPAGAFPSPSPLTLRRELTDCQHVGKWLSGNVMIWGILLLASAGVKNFAGLMVSLFALRLISARAQPFRLQIVRFILGIFESCIFGGFGLIVAMWWKTGEQPWRTAVIFSTLSSVMNGLLSYACANMTPRDHFKQWQLLFILVGSKLPFPVLCELGANLLARQ